MEIIQEKKFYDRCSELKFLREKYENLQKGEFGVIYGRRRMGKSELLRKFVKKVKTKKMYINVIDSSKKSLMNTLSTKINETYKETLKISEWKDFFDYLVEKTKSESLVFVIDEFQRIYEFSKDFVFHLQEYWDSILKNPERFIAILRAISEGKVESKEIADFIGFENFEISPYLKNLSELLDMIESNDPLFGKKRMKRYKIKDNFFRFWYKFVYPYRAHIEIGNTKFISDKINKEFLDYCGRIFEDIIKEFFIFMNGKIIKNKKIDFEECGKWWEGGEDIDLVLKTKSGTIFIECKFKEKQIGLDCFEELKRKSLKSSASGKFSYILISKSGFEQNLIDKKISELLLLNLDDLTEIMDSETKREVKKQEELIKYFDL